MAYNDTRLRRAIIRLAHENPDGIRKHLVPLLSKNAARYREISIGALEKGVRNMARKLEQKGFTIAIDVFRTGRGGHEHYGPSYVELEITGSHTDEDGDEEELGAIVKFIAGGYATMDRDDIFGTSGWRDMAKRGLEHLKRELKSQGWQGPLW